MRERRGRGRRITVVTAGVIALAAVVVLAGCEEAGAGGGSGSGSGGGSPSVAVSEALLTTGTDDGTTVVALSLFSQLGDDYDVPDGTDLIQIYFFVDTEGEEINGDVDLAASTAEGNASATVGENLNQSDNRWFVATSGTVDTEIPDFSKTTSGTTENVSVEGTISIQQFLPEWQPTTAEFSVSYDGPATVVSEDDMEDYQ
ncbi:MAG: hypothetical protein R6W94_00845 [Spirochaetia bacterium]